MESKPEHTPYRLDASRAHARPLRAGTYRALPRLLHPPRNILSTPPVRNALPRRERLVVRCPTSGYPLLRSKRTSTLAINPGPTLPNVSFPSEEGTQNSHAPIAARRSKPPALERDWLRSAVRFFFFPPACDSSRGPSGSPSRYTIGGAPCSARWSPLEPRAVPPESAD
jgi:hypothetical protein